MSREEWGLTRCRREGRWSQQRRELCLYQRMFRLEHARIRSARTAVDGGLTPNGHARGGAVDSLTTSWVASSTRCESSGPPCACVRTVRRATRPISSNG